MKIVLLATLLLLPWRARGTEKNALKDWSFLAYHGQSTETDYLKLIRFLPPRHFNTFLTAVEADRRLTNFWEKRFQLEWAFNLAHRWEYHYQPNFLEFNTFLLLRWQEFPWNKFIYTTVAFGEGISYATRTPRKEILDSSDPNYGTGRLLNFLSWEITAGTTKCKDWSLVYRIHHRSSIWGLYNNGRFTASNVTAFGVRYTFQSDCSTF